MQPQTMQQMNSEKDWLVTLILSIVVGGFAYSMKKTNAVLFSILIIVTSLAGCLGE